ncbi:MAG TPA: hypothetical protein PKC18_09265 [Lacipirellulaceae bacterium]|nr:hypothetical protein [Lacipirellulaceae bacterium]HMP05956.1 hypothetical protein [Lacipirellulaceae bacterium]
MSSTNAFETSAIVGADGEIHLAGVPFQPGAEVAVVVSPKAGAAATKTDVSAGIGALLAALDRAGNAEPIGPLKREELYDRRDVH